MCRGPLKPAGFERRLREHPDLALRNTLLDIISFGAKTGYTGPKQRIISENSSSALKDPKILTEDILLRASLNQIQEIPAGNLPKYFISSPLSLTQKSNGGWRRIHNLSFPPGRSVNDHIPQDWGSLKFTHFDEAVKAIRWAGQSATLVKRDLADAFRHIPVHPDDWWLLGFSWQKHYYYDQYLPFGLRTSPIIFDLFSSALEWILQNEGWDRTLHYLDDFLGVIPPHGKADAFIKDFDRICVDLGFKINKKKNQQGTQVIFLGIEIDTIKMEARLPPKKRQKCITQLKAILQQPTASYSDLDSLVGSLSFAAGISPDSRGFLQRLNQVLRAGRRNRSPIAIAGEAREDLLWWHSLLQKWNGTSLLLVPTTIFRIWIDASITGGIGGHFLRNDQKDIRSYSNRSQMFNWHVPGKPGDLDYNKLHAVLHAFQTWEDNLEGRKVILHCDNATITDAMRTNNISGPALAPLRSLAILIAVKHITLEAVCIPATQNDLANALSTSNDKRIASLCPQLQSPAKNAAKNTGKITQKGSPVVKVTATITQKVTPKHAPKSPPTLKDTGKVTPKGTPKDAAKKPNDTVKEGSKNKPIDGMKVGVKNKQKDGVKDGSKNKPIDGMKDGAKNKQKDGVKDGAKYKPKDAVKDAAKNNSKDVVKDAAKEPKDTAKDAAKKKPKDAAKDAAKNKPKDAAKDAAKNKPKDAVKDVATKKLKDTVEQTPKDKAKKTPKDMAKDTAKNKPHDAAKHKLQNKAKDTAKTKR